MPRMDRQVSPRWSAKAIDLRSALSAALLAIVLAASARAEDAATAGESAQQVEAKITYCEVCHGPQARGFVGYYPTPRLAGQQVTYIENQLRGFIARERAFPIMQNVAHTLSPAMLTAIAEKFHSFDPPPVGGAPAGLAADGEKIFKNGNPSVNVPPCQACHGPDAKGNGQFPRLAGQIYPYVVRQLTDWDKERHENLSGMMAPIAHHLDETQIKQVAAYVSGLQ